MVRQTVSKWEQVKSVPDADLLIAMADYFGVNVAELLGSKLERKQGEPSEIAEALARINAQLAATEQRRKNGWKMVFRVIIGILIFCLLLIILSVVAFSAVTPTEEVGVVQEIVTSEEEAE